EGVTHAPVKVTVLGAGAATSAGPVCTGLPHLPSRLETVSGHGPVLPGHYLRRRSGRSGCGQSLPPGRGGTLETEIVGRPTISATGGGTPWTHPPHPTRRRPRTAGGAGSAATTPRGGVRRISPPCPVSRWIRCTGRRPAPWYPDSPGSAGRVSSP